mmetsp:Transcript_20786/g.66897  ORF Transcript_20786/g.66897 Transcript_20786/m.66897 type:complete len:466 (-) Transcript_20786:191-1588(-)
MGVGDLRVVALPRVFGGAPGPGGAPELRAVGDDGHLEREAGKNDEARGKRGVEGLVARARRPGVRDLFTEIRLPRGQALRGSARGESRRPAPSDGTPQSRDPGFHRLRLRLLEGFRHVGGGLLRRRRRRRLLRKQQGRRAVVGGIGERLRRAAAGVAGGSPREDARQVRRRRPRGRRLGHLLRRLHRQVRLRLAPGRRRHLRRHQAPRLLGRRRRRLAPGRGSRPAHQGHRQGPLGRHRPRGLLPRRQQQQLRRDRRALRLGRPERLRRLHRRPGLGRRQKPRRTRRRRSARLRRPQRRPRLKENGRPRLQRLRKRRRPRRPPARQSRRPPRGNDVLGERRLLAPGCAPARTHHRRTAPSDLTAQATATEQTPQRTRKRLLRELRRLNERTNDTRVGVGAHAHTTSRSIERKIRNISLLIHSVKSEKHSHKRRPLSYLYEAPDGRAQTPLGPLCFSPPPPLNKTL